MGLYLAKQFDQRNLASLHVIEPDWVGGTIKLTGEFGCDLRHRFHGGLIFCAHYTAERAERLVREGIADGAAFGRPYIANRDLVERFRQDAALNEPDASTFYAGGAAGYTDYPFLQTTEA